MYGGGGRGRGGGGGRGGGRGRGGPRGGGGGGGGAGGGGGNRRYSDPERKLFVGGLDRNTTEDGLKTYFASFGEITEVNLSKNPETGQSKGFAFLTFPSKDCVDQVQTQRPHTIDGRAVGTLRVLPKDPTGQTDTMQQVKKLFVGGIKGPVEESDLREVFTEYGNIVSIAIPTDKSSGRQKGFVFIEFDDTDCVDNAFLCKNRIQVKGASVDVKKAFEKGAETSARGRGRGGGRGAGGRGGASGYGGRGGYEEDSYGGYDDGYGGYDGGYDASGYGAGGYDGYGGGYSSAGGYGREEGGGYESGRAGRGGGYGARGGYGSSPSPAARGGYGKPQGYGKPAEPAGRGGKGGYGSGYGGGYEADGYGGGYESKGYGEEYGGSGGYWEQGEGGYGSNNGYGGGRGGGRGAARGGSRGRGGGGAIRTPRGRARPQPYSNGGGY